MASQTSQVSLYGDIPHVSSQSEIRLLQVLPSGDDRTPMKFRLFKTALQNAPPFTALSYVWGDPEKTEAVIVNAIKVPITINLYSALSHIQYLFQTSDMEPIRGNLLWVDALCINQEDLDEKGHQVALMGDIFQSAANVVAWLGEGDSYTELAIRTIEEIGAAMPQDFILGGVPSEDWLDALPHVWSRGEGLADEVFNRPLQAVENFMKRSYWSRSWIVQEIVLARKDPLFMVSGTILKYSALEKLMFLWDGILESSSIPYESRLAILKSLSPRGSSLSSIYWLRNVVRKDSGDIGRVRHDWPQGILQMAADGMMATDPRDNIFAFCGLGLTSLTPDYTASIRRIYSRFAKEAIELGLSSQVWQYAGVGLTKATNATYSLPSWVPDLPSIAHLRGTIPPLFSQGFTSNGGLDGEQVGVDDDSCLSCLGYSIDHVSKLFERRLDAKEFTRHVLSELGSTWSRQSTRNSRTPVSTFLRTILVDCANMAERTRLMNDKGAFIKYCVEFLRIFSRQHDNVELQAAINLPNEDETRPLDYFHNQFFPGDVMAPIEAVQWPATYQDIWHSKVDPQVSANLSSSFGRIQSLFLTTDGSLGLGPARMQVGDRIFVLPMCNVPLLLREMNGHYLLVGVCFILGLMDGEVADIVRSEQLKPVSLEIR
ncbi:heterokaryon incompatibility protein-domain-containing protein [Nemania abortiva]|nr:heterokaryon incompatibility protein-domain-containing protein [Nemania abortiva]